jgi:hypothetical protein
MARLATQCAQHPDRRAIGVCVVTGRAICAECSTQYRGVNYSKEGLEQYLAEQSGPAAGGAGVVAAAGWALLVLAAPVAGWVMWRGVDLLGQWIVDLMQAGRVVASWRAWGLTGGVG